MSNKEIRLFGEVRSLKSNLQSNEDMIVEGYALKFNSLSEDFGGYYEMIAPTALDNADLSDVRCFADHDSSKVLGRNKAGTLELRIDEVGLYFKCHFPDTSYAKDLYNSIVRGDVSQMSFGFKFRDNGYHPAIVDGKKVRMVTDIEKVLEVSVVSIPAYSDTLVAVAQRNLESLKEDFDKFEMERQSSQDDSTLETRKEGRLMDFEKELTSLQEQIKAKKADGIRAIESGDVDSAKAIQEEINALNTQIEALNVKKEEMETLLEGFKDADDSEESEVTETIEEVEEVVEVAEEEEARSEDEGKEEDSEEESKEENEEEFRSMKEIKDLQVNEKRSAFEAYIRTKGVEKRDGIVSTDVGVLIPEGISHTPQEQPHTVVDLRKMANRVPVSTAGGKYPVLKANKGKMISVAELQANPELAKPEFIQVQYDIDTYRGYIPVSQESIDDAQADLTSLIQKSINQMALNTANGAIATVLKSFTAKAVADLDEVKTVLNVDLNPAYNAKFVVSQSFFNEVDTMKDLNGRYLLQQDITVASGYKLFGREVVVLEDTMLGTAGAKVAFVGDVDAGVAFFDRKQVAVKWQDNEVYGQVLAGVIRFDAVKADADAGFFLTLS